MSRPRTLFIVGAGASKDYGLPVGPELQAAIADFVQPRHQTETGLHPVIEAALPELYEREAKISDIIEQCKWMAQALPLAPSIDTFLERQSTPDDALSLIGKISIAYLIHEKEFNSPLCTFGRPIDFSDIAKTWLGKLWNLTNVGGSVKSTDNPLPGISFLTFNYDRCIEQFLLSATAAFYKASLSESSRLISGIPIEHVYGSLGDITPDNISYPINRKISTPEYIDVAKRIRTFSEQVEGNAIDRISELFNSADRLVFLGFSFGKINTELIRKAIRNYSIDSIKEVYATSYRMSFSDQEFAKNWADAILRPGYQSAHFVGVTASQFFDEHSLMFS